MYDFTFSDYNGILNEGDNILIRMPDGITPKNDCGGGTSLCSAYIISFVDFSDGNGEVELSQNVTCSFIEGVDVDGYDRYVSCEVPANANSDDGSSEIYFGNIQNYQSASFVSGFFVKMGSDAWTTDTSEYSARYSETTFATEVTIAKD